MAGVGFVLRKLTARGDLLGLAQGYFHASVSSSGGWLFTILTLSAITFFGPRFATYDDLSNVPPDRRLQLRVLAGPHRSAHDGAHPLSVRPDLRAPVEGVPGMVVGGLALAICAGADRRALLFLVCRSDARAPGSPPGSDARWSRASG